MIFSRKYSAVGLTNAELLIQEYGFSYCFNNSPLLNVLSCSQNKSFFRFYFNSYCFLMLMVCLCFSLFTSIIKITQKKRQVKQSLLITKQAAIESIIYEFSAYEL